jgi:putative addiction module CopG family antidote
MPARSTLNVSITPELSQLIAEKVASGRYRSASEVVREALRDLDESAAPAANGDRENELVTILEGIGEGFYSVDRDWRITRFNNEASRHFRRAAGDVIGQKLWDVFPGARDTDLGRLFAATMESRQPVKSETPSVVIDGRWLAYRLFPIGDGMGVVFRDITDRKSAEEQRDLLIGELNHRVKNTLATVQAIATQTLRSANVDPALRQTLEARLQTLGNAHGVLTDKNWAGADLHDVIWSALHPHSTPDRRQFSVEGPNMLLRPVSAVAFSLAMHELCTNAIKYGALSAEAGNVTVHWKVEDGRFRLEWREHGGPPVDKPTRKGFGSSMIERALAAQLRGQVAIDYAPAGLVCTIDAPFEAIRETGATNS